MKKIWQWFVVGLFLIAFSGGVSGSNDLPGFKGYLWGTGFEVINREKDLDWFENSDERGMHMSLNDGETDAQGQLKTAYLFGFYKNKLVSGEVNFFNKSDYFDGVKVLEKKLGPGFYHKEKNVSSFTLDSTIIWCQPNRQRIIFLDRAYYEDKEKRDQAAAKEKKDKKYDRFFN
ncbi:MAG: hypothetical protein KBA38_07390 [Negativicutes bacterium]|nr:hypothetical protein [Negativicutes bacterium]